MLRTAKLMICAVFLLGISTAQSKSSASSVSGTKPLPMRLEQSPTDVDREPITERQFKNRALFDKHPSFGNLRQRVRSEGDIWMGGEVPLTVLSPDKAAPSQVERLKKLACGADLVVSGTVVSKSSQLTKNESWIFTEYEVAVQQIIRSTEKINVAAGSTVIVTRSGGVVRLEGRVVNVSDGAFALLVPGKSYVFFLSYLPDSDSFNSAGPGDALERRGDKLFTIGSMPVDWPSEWDARNLTDLNSLSADECGSSTRQKHE